MLYVVSQSQMHIWRIRWTFRRQRGLIPWTKKMHHWLVLKI